MSINSFTYNGVSSETLGLYVGGQQTFGSPQRDVTKVSIPGRNGDLVRDNGRFLNAEIAYNVVAMSDFKNKAKSVRNWLMSAKGYQRLEDTYHPEHYRMARVADTVDFETGAFNANGKAKVIFDCMPQRFLKTGETPVSCDPVSYEESGDPATFNAIGEFPFIKAAVSLSPSQDLNGYSNPWAGGCGANLYANCSLSRSVADINVTHNVSDESYTIDGTASANRNVVSSDSITLAAGTYYLQLFASASTNIRPQLRNADASVTYRNGTGSFTLASETVVVPRLYIPSGESATNLVYRISITAGSSAPASWTPYSNLCPITGETGATLNQSGDNIFTDTFVSGKTVTQGVIEDNASRCATLNGMAVLPNTKYRISYNGGGNCGVYYYDASDTYLSMESGWGASPRVFTTPASAAIVRFSYNRATVPTSCKLTRYEAYPVTFADQGTVYGGTYDWATGKLTVTWKSVLGSSLSWTWLAELNIAYADTGDKAYGQDNFYCSAYKVVDKYFRNLASGEACGHTSNANVIVKNDSWPDLTGAEADLASVQFVYELDTPIEYTLTPASISTLIGQNNVWSDKGAVELEYSRPAYITNPTMFDAKPIIRANGSGTCTVTIGNQIITLTDVSGYIDIDCETMNCYNGVVNCNSKVTLGAQGFPTLPPGDTWISFGGGTTSVVITPRWWEL